MCKKPTPGESLLEISLIGHWDTVSGNFCFWYAALTLQSATRGVLRIYVSISGEEVGRDKGQIGTSFLQIAVETLHQVPKPLTILWKNRKGAYAPTKGQNDVITVMQQAAQCPYPFLHLLKSRGNVGETPVTLAKTVIGLGKNKMGQNQNLCETFIHKCPMQKAYSFEINESRYARLAWDKERRYLTSVIHGKHGRSSFMGIWKLLSQVQALTASWRYERKDLSRRRLNSPFIGNEIWQGKSEQNRKMYSQVFCRIRCIRTDHSTKNDTKSAHS